VRIPDILASSQMHGDAHTFEGSYRPNIMPGEPPKGVYTISKLYRRIYTLLVSYLKGYIHY